MPEGHTPNHGNNFNTINNEEMLKSERFRYNLMFGEMKKVMDKQMSIILNSLDVGDTSTYISRVRKRYGDLMNCFSDIGNEDSYKPGDCSVTIGTKVSKLKRAFDSFTSVIPNYNNTAEDHDPGSYYICVNLFAHLCDYKDTIRSTHYCSPASSLITFNRNQAEHRAKMDVHDPIYGVMDGHYCNVYMMCTTCMYALYALLEILMTWAKKINSQVLLECYNVHNYPKLKKDKYGGNR